MSRRKTLTDEDALFVRRAAVWLAHTEELCEQAFACFRQVWTEWPAMGPLQLVHLWGDHQHAKECTRPRSSQQIAHQLRPAVQDEIGDRRRKLQAGKDKERDRKTTEQEVGNAWMLAHIVQGFAKILQEIAARGPPYLLGAHKKQADDDR